MGYDMHTVQPADDAEREAVQAAQAHVRSLPSPFRMPEGEERDAAQKAWDEAWAAYDRAQKSYFRLNIWGMSRCCDLMAHAGMLTGDQAPRFPTPDEYGLQEWPDDPADYDGEERKAAEEKLTDAGRSFIDACQAVTDFESEPVAGIPIGKFSSNDGWLVTPRQCEAALAQWAAAPVATRVQIEGEAEWWPNWIAFLQHAKDRGGFRVH